MASTGRCSSTTGFTAPPSTSAAELADQLVEIDTVVALKDSTPNAQQFYETTRTVVDRVRVFGPFMSVEGFEHLLADGGDGFIGGGTIFGAADVGFWESYWSGDHDACRAHAVRVDRLFPKLWLPGRVGWCVRRLPEPAEGDHEDDRPAGRRAAPAAAAGERPGEPRCDRADPPRGVAACRRKPKSHDVLGSRPRRNRGRGHRRGHRVLRAGRILGRPVRLHRRGARHRSVHR